MPNEKRIITVRHRQVQDGESWREMVTSRDVAWERTVQESKPSTTFSNVWETATLTNKESPLSRFLTQDPRENLTSPDPLLS
jgi:hypothetical protein